MRRGIHIAVALLAVFLLARPFDCLSSGKFDKKAAACCKKGNCSPSNADDCCKATIPGGNQLVTGAAPDHSAGALAVEPASLAFAAGQLAAALDAAELQQPPGSPPDVRLNLPLLI